MTYFYEERFFGIWRPRTSALHPNDGPENNSRPIRAVKLVPPELTGLSLDELQQHLGAGAGS